MPEVLVDALDEEVSYSSQWVLSDLNGKAEVADYLRAKMETIRASPEARVFAQLARTQKYPMYGLSPEPCVVIGQGTAEDLVATVLFTVSETKIIGIDICMIPPPHTTKRLGVFPAASMQ